ncbi:hypothetical protein SAY87_016068 [Trapa incisa]|uniref:Uncharacterized protein n=1 Tax=Trapa incisa TaxID=236973 RepID=A0AAN7LGK8_9MYRT|nr:hypothetical protein SAY87_016068 [Trapa incisa]
MHTILSQVLSVEGDLHGLFALGLGDNIEHVLRAPTPTGGVSVTRDMMHMARHRMNALPTDSDWTHRTGTGR